MLSSSCRALTEASRPLGQTNTITYTTQVAPAVRPRRPRRVLYPACRSRRPTVREASDPARRWLLLLSALVFIQIYNEETQSCTELQSQCPDSAACQPQEGDASLGTGQGWTGEEPWRVQLVGGAAEPQSECVVA